MLLKLIAFLFIALPLFGRHLGGIALTVNGKPVTSHEIRLIQQTDNLSYQQAKLQAIDKRLFETEISKIKLKPEAIDEKIEEIAAKNSISISKMRRELKKQGVSWQQYRKNIDFAIKKSIFLHKKIGIFSKKPTHSELLRFYRKNKKRFTVPSAIDYNLFKAPSLNDLKEFLSGLPNNSVAIEHKSLSYDKIPSLLLPELLSTAEGSFTHPLKTEQGIVICQILFKDSDTTLPFSSVKETIYNLVMKEKEKKAIEKYLKKERASAIIRQKKRR